ncbi:MULTISPECIES: TonB-dependent receptor [unclassified Novosphingobium]|uniref:TonB-dependent receptor n=1 Tax=unclassified Novosphingobium TaxID=2644732 RepID=UPI001358A534|nr:MULTISPECIES: TonB-dependent receptor [unclassified Novosphingobium]
MLGRQAGVEILLNAPGRERLQTTPVHGNISASDALARMIRGLGLAIRRVSPRVYVVVEAPVSRRSKLRTKPSSAAEAQEILVSARRRPEREEDVPLLVTKLDAGALKNAAVRTIADVARLTPGFIATGQTSSATPLLVLRGQRRSISDENRLPLVIYQDEVPLPNQAALSPLFDVATVEVLRGPQGTLFGRNATSGAVLLRSVQPGQGVPGYLEAEAGSYGLARVEGAVELPVSGPFTLRVSGQRMRRDGYTRLLAGGRADDVHSDAVRAVLLFDPAGPLRSTTSFDMLRADEKGAALVLAGVYPAGSDWDAQNGPYYDCGAGACDVDSYYEAQKALGRRTSQSSPALTFGRRFQGLGNVTEYGDDAFLVRNIVGLRSTKVHYQLDGDGTPLRINDSVNTSHLRQLTEELQVQGRTGNLRYIAGLFYLDSAPDGPVIQTVSRFVRPDNPASHIASYQIFRSGAVFGQITATLGNGYVADFGLRYTSEKIAGCSLRSVEAKPLSTRQCIEDGGTQAQSSSGRLTWTLSLMRKRGDSSIFITTRRAFRSGGYNTPALGGTLRAYQTFRPEMLTDLELGAKGRWNMGAFSGSYAAAAYVGIYDDVQRALFPNVNHDGDGDPATDPITLYVNSARARVAGFDSDLSLDMGKQTRATLSASWIDARYTRLIVPMALTSLLGSDPLHNRFTYTPTFSGTVSFTHEISLPERLGTLELQADYAHVSSVRFTERVTESFAKQSAYGLLGASVTWMRPASLPLELQLWGRNLTNRFYAGGGGTLNPSYTAATIIPGVPRTIGLRLRYTFD